MVHFIVSISYPLKALTERAKELKEIAEKLLKESDQLMREYESLKVKKRGRARTSAKSEGGPNRPTSVKRDAGKLITTSEGRLSTDNNKPTMKGPRLKGVREMIQG